MVAGCRTLYVNTKGCFKNLINKAPSIFIISSNFIVPKYKNNSNKKMLYRPKKSFVFIGIELGSGVT